MHVLKQVKKIVECILFNDAFLINDSAFGCPLGFQWFSKPILHPRKCTNFNSLSKATNMRWPQNSIGTFNSYMPLVKNGIWVLVLVGKNKGMVSNQDASIRSTPFFLWLLVAKYTPNLSFSIWNQKKVANYYIWMKG